MREGKQKQKKNGWGVTAGATGERGSRIEKGKTVCMGGGDRSQRTYTIKGGS